MRKQILSVEPSTSRFGQEDLERPPGPFFIFTSNVDSAFLKTGFSYREVYEVHGTTELWQCSDPCGPKLWRVPSDYSFPVDRETLLFLNDEENEPNPKETGFGKQYPACIQKDCRFLARPAVLMFNDLCCFRDKLQKLSYDIWYLAALEMIGKGAKLAIIEIGAGKLIPTVRNESEKFLKYISEQKLADGNAKIIRINANEFEADTVDPSCVLGIKSTALSALQRIDCEMQKIRTNQ